MQQGRLMVVVVVVVALAACKGKSAPGPEGSGSAGASGAAGAGSAEIAREKSIKADLVGTDPDKLAFEATPLLGLSLEEFTKVYGQYRTFKVDDARAEPDQFTLPGANAFPGVVPRRRDLTVHLEWKGRQIASYWIDTDHTLRSEILAALTEVRGAPVPIGDLDQQGQLFTTGVKTAVTIETSGGFLKILVRR